MATIWTEVEVDVDLDQFDDEELIHEMETRGLETNRGKICELFDDLRKPNANEHELISRFIWETIGRNY